MRTWRAAARWTGLVLVLGAIVSVAGCFLPFVIITGDHPTLSSDGFNSGSYDSSNAGAYFVAVAAAAALVGILTVVRSGWLLLHAMLLVFCISGVVVSLFTLTSAGQDEENLSQDNPDRTFVGETGIGAYLQLVAVSMYLVGAVAGLATQRSRDAIRHA